MIWRASHPHLLQCYDDLILTNGQNGFATMSCVYEMLGLLEQHCLREFSSDTKPDAVIAAAIRYMEEDYAEPLSARLLAKKFGYSPEYFCRRFKAGAWLTPTKYLNVYRLEAAVKLLKERALPITEIAMLCGFDDANYFTRCFKKQYGVSPTKYLAAYIQSGL